MSQYQVKVFFIEGPFCLLFAVPSGVTSALCITWMANENKKRLNTNETLDKNLEQLENEVKQRYRYLDSCIRNWNEKDPNEYAIQNKVKQGSSV